MDADAKAHAPDIPVADAEIKSSVVDPGVNVKCLLLLLSMQVLPWRRSTLWGVLEEDDEYEGVMIDRSIDYEGMQEAGEAPVRCGRVGSASALRGGRRLGDPWASCDLTNQICFRGGGGTEL